MVNGRFLIKGSTWKDPGMAAIAVYVRGVSKLYFWFLSTYGSGSSEINYFTGCVPANCAGGKCLTQFCFST